MVSVPATAIADERRTADGNENDPAFLHVLTDPFDARAAIVTAVLGAGAIGLLATDDIHDIESVGDVTQLIPSIVGFLATLPARDRQGTVQFAAHGAATFGVVHALKPLVEKTRPNFGDARSFPSGHTAASFQGAHFIQRRYGPRWGTPAYVLAAYTGASRVYAQKHYLDDVLSGMSIALLSGWALVQPHPGRVRLRPAVFDDGATGVEIEVGGHAGDQTATTSPGPWSFTWEFGTVFMRHNDVRAPATGDTFSVLFDKENNPTTSARVAVAYRFGRHTASASFLPFEVRERARFETDTDFGGATIPAGLEFFSSYVSYETRLDYEFSVVRADRVDARVGGGLSHLDTEVSFVDGEGSVFSSARVTLVAPLLDVGLRIRPHPVWLIETTAEAWLPVGDVKQSVLVTAGVGYRLHPSWKVGLNYTYADSRIDAPEMWNDAAADVTSLSFAYSF